MIRIIEERFWEIDFFRGVAIVMMILFHSLYDLDYLGFYAINLHFGFWWFFARVTASIFILLVGICLTISYSRAKVSKSLGEMRIKYLARGLKVFSWGMMITLVTWLYLRDGFIVFGILHFIGLSIILAYPFLRFRYLNLLVGILLILTGTYLAGISVDFPWLSWLAFSPAFYTIDYFPLLPWFGLVLVGMFLGNSLYSPERRFHLELNFPGKKLLCLMGRHSLLIYLLHQPMLIGLLHLL